MVLSSMVDSLLNAMCSSESLHKIITAGVNKAPHVTVMTRPRRRSFRELIYYSTTEALFFRNTLF